MVPLWAFNPYALQLCFIVLSAGVATAIRWLLDPLLSDLSPFSTYYLAVVVAAMLGGFRVALVTAVFCALAAHFFWVEPRLSLAFLGKGQLAQVGVFLVEATLISGAVSVVKFLRMEDNYPN